MAQPNRMPIAANAIAEPKIGDFEFCIFVPKGEIFDGGAQKLWSKCVLALKVWVLSV